MRPALTGSDYLEQLPELMEMICGKCSVHVGRYCFNNLFSLPMGELQYILRCKWQTFWQVGFVERRKNREAKEEEGCQGGHKHCRKGSPSCGSHRPLPASQIAGSQATEDTGQCLIHTEGNKKMLWNFIWQLCFMNQCFFTQPFYSQ